jgi:AcrR family transcriptional regulator
MADLAARRQEILDAALALADERGLDAVSMRAVAQRVGVTPMALYPYIGNKDALLDGLVDRLLANLLPTLRLDGSWPQRMRGLCRAARALARAHPATFSLLWSRPSVTPDAVRVVDAIYQALLDAGVPPAEVPRVERMVSTFVLGFATSEANGRFRAGSINPRGRRGQFAPDEVPAHRQLAEWLDKDLDLDAEFEADLDDLERLIRAIASANA